MQHVLDQPVHSYCAFHHASEKIPVERLNALPYSISCVKCQREMETTSSWGGGRFGDNWDNVVDHDGGEPSRADLSNLEMDYSR